MMKLQPSWIADGKLSRCGENGLLKSVSMVLKNDLDRDAPGLFPPDLIIQVKAIACELPAKYGLPLSHWSAEDIVRYVQHSGIIASISGSHGMAVVA